MYTIPDLVVCAFNGIQNTFQGSILFYLYAMTAESKWWKTKKQATLRSSPYFVMVVIARRFCPRDLSVSSTGTRHILHFLKISKLSRLHSRASRKFSNKLATLKIRAALVCHHKQVSKFILVSTLMYIKKLI